MKSKALLLAVILSQLTCHQVIFTAPPGSSIDCQANPVAISAFNGVAVISCLLQEEIGTPVSDGTVVQFFTDLGRIPEQGKTNDGVVRVNLQADGRSGMAHVIASSGAGSLPAPTTATVTTTPAQRGVSASDAGGAVALSGLMTSDDVTVAVGNANAKQLRISADPLRITDSRSSQITATVFDEFGNPVAGVPVYFTVGAGTIIGPSPTPTGTPTPPPSTTPSEPGAGTEHMDSQGAPVFTDTNGRATDVLRTRWPRDGRQRSVVVSASVPIGSVSGASVTVIIN